MSDEEGYLIEHWDGAKLGPFTVEELRVHALSGWLSASATLRREGIERSIPVLELDGLAAILLWRAAESYAEQIAQAHLACEAVPPPPLAFEPPDETGKMVERINAIMRSLPGVDFGSSHAGWIVHYLFPNLDDSERGLLTEMALQKKYLVHLHEMIGGYEAGSDEESALGRRLSFENANHAELNGKYNASGIEKKLTAVQLQIVE